MSLFSRVGRSLPSAQSPEAVGTAMGPTTDIAKGNDCHRWEAIEAPERTLDCARSELGPLAEAATARDVAQGLDPETLAPTPGEASVAAAAGRHRVQMVRAEQESAQAMTQLVASIDRVEEAHQRGEPVAPHDVARRPFRPYEAVLGITATGIEMMALQGPIAILLALDTDSWEARSIASAVAAAAAISAAFFGDACVDASGANPGDATVPRVVRDRGRRRAIWLALGVVLVAAFAVVARVYAQDLAGTLNGGVALDPGGVVGFVLFQTVFVLLTLTLGWSHAHRLNRNRQRHETDWLRTRRDIRDEVSKRLVSSSESRRQREDELHAVTHEAFTHYRTQLPAGVADFDTEAAVRWRHRFATDPWNGWHTATTGESPKLHLVDANPENLSLETDEVIDLTTEDPIRERPETADLRHEPDESDEDLFEAILNPLDERDHRIA